jgi:hypothetical protein
MKELSIFMEEWTNMKFKDYPYSRPDIEEIKAKFQKLIERFTLASSFREQDECLVAINQLRGEFESMSQIVSIRQTIDTTDSYYEKEQEYFDETMPIYQGLISDFYQALGDSKFRVELEGKWGQQLFRIAELTLKTFKPEIIEELQLENKLTTEYTKLIASAKILFEGEERNLPGLGMFLQ